MAQRTSAKVRPRCVSYDRDLLDGSGAGHLEHRPPMERRFSHFLKEQQSNLHCLITKVQDLLLTEAWWKSLFNELKKNWKSAATVALVNLPLSISLAVAASSDPVSGVITAVWAGLFAGLLGGCQFNIVGPTGAISGILARSVAHYGVEALPILSILAGLICFIVLWLKWERYVLLVPASVMEGFTLGVAIIIGLNQLNFALGLSKYTCHESFVQNIFENLSHRHDTEPWAVVFFVASFATLLMLARLWQHVPWVVVIASIGIGFGALSSNGVIKVPLQTLATRFGDVHFKLARIPTMQTSYLTLDFLANAVSIAFVALLETLISAKIADSLTKSHFNQRGEVFGLGLANIITGCVGGIPATAALARTALNIASGAASRASAVLNAIIVLALAITLLPAFKYLPLPVVAGMICVVAIRMVDAHHLMRFWKLDKRAFATALFVALLCIVEDPTAAIVVGTVISMLSFSDKVSQVHSELVTVDTYGPPQSTLGNREIMYSEKPRESLESKPNSQHTCGSNQPVNIVRNSEEEAALPCLLHTEQLPMPERHLRVSTVVYHISGHLTYINATAHKTRLEAFANCDNVVISLRHVYLLDIDGLDTLFDSIQQLSAGGKKVVISDVNPDIAPLITNEGWFRRMAESSEVFLTCVDALQALESISAADAAVLASAFADHFGHGTELPSEEAGSAKGTAKSPQIHRIASILSF